MAPQNEIKEEVASFFDEVGAEKRKARAGLWLWIILAFALLLGTGIIVLATSSNDSSTGPTGKIVQPENGSKISRNIIISGQTENIPPNRPFIVIAVDVKDIGLCWPKKPIIEPNTRFLTSFYEGGPTGKVVVSLYAVHQDLYDKIKQWFKEKRLGGMPIFPDRYRLDSVTLKVN